MAYKINGENVSYDYTDFIEEIQSDIDEGLLELSSIIFIVRDSDYIRPDINYKPIIDYYYPDDYKEPDEQFKKDCKSKSLERASVLAVLEEMKKWNNFLD